MKVSALLLCWGCYHWAHNLWVLIIYVFFLPVLLPSVLQGSPQTQQWECFLAFGNFSLFWVPSQDGAPSLPLLSLFLSFIFCPSSFCSAFKCSVNEFVGEKVVSSSYSSAVLGTPLETWDLNSTTRDWTHTPCTGSTVLSFIIWTFIFCLGVTD